jgi:hypothetical protein
VEFPVQQAQQHSRLAFHTTFAEHVLVKAGLFQFNVIKIEHFSNLLSGEFGQFVDQHSFQQIQPIKAKVQQFSFWRKPKEQGHPSTQTAEDVSRNDATAQRKSLFVAPLRRCVRLSLPLILGRSRKLMPE